MTTAGLPRSLSENPRIDRWIGFEPDGTILVRTGKVEIGQGVLTALTQMAAEELDVGPERVQIVSGDTEATPDEIYTSGSLSIEISGRSIRLVCAEARHIVLDHLARKLGCAAAELSVVDGRFLRGQTETGYDYWQLAPEIDLARAATGSCALKHPSEFRTIGRSHARLDLPDKIAGAPFIQDLAPSGVLHARVLRRPARGAHIAEFDTQRLQRLAPGHEIVRHGDLLAFVSCSERAADAALAAARRVVRWESEEPISADAGAPRTLMALPAVDRSIEIGSVPSAAPTQTIEAVYSRPYLSHASIGLSCALATFRDGRLEVITHSQGVFPLRAALARALGLDADRIVVRHHQGAGCYGHNGADDVALDAAAVAMRMPGHPVRVQWTREDELAAAPLGSAMTIRLHAGIGSAGYPTQWTIEIWSGIHSRRPGRNGVNLLGADVLPDPPPAAVPADVPDATGGGAVRNAVAPYDFPCQRIVHHMLPELPVRTSALRSLGAFANVFAIEGFLDEIAAIAGADPVAYRLALLPDLRARRVIEMVAAMSGWEPAAAIGGGRAKGVGFARYKGSGAYGAVAVEVAVDDSVRLLHVWCAVDGGLIINPDGAMNQIEGGIIQAASWTLKEEMRFVDGRIASTSFETYPILLFSEGPPVDIRLLDAGGEPPSGLGEVALGPTAAAIGNAVARALGTRIRHLPLTRERISAALLSG